MIDAVILTVGIFIMLAALCLVVWDTGRERCKECWELLDESYKHCPFCGISLKEPKG